MPFIENPVQRVIDRFPSQHAAAVAIGISVTGLVMLRDGVPHSMKPATVQAFARVAGVSGETFLERYRAWRETYHAALVASATGGLET